MVFRAGPAGV